MAGARTRSVGSGTDTIAFELERFEVDEDQRIEVVGRWFGIRGRRFVRPTLRFGGGGDGGWHRALAELDHKPWAPEEGEPWIATFRLDLPAEAGQAELAVAPDIAVDLPALLQSGRGRNGRRAKPTLLPRIEPDRSDHTGAAAAEKAPRRRSSAVGAGPDARSELREAQTEIARLRETRDAAYERLAGEREARAAAQAQLKQERGGDSPAAGDGRSGAPGVERARSEREAAFVERDEAREEVRRIRAERDAVVVERDAAAVERDAAVAERDAAREEARRFRVQREAALAERDAAASERDRAVLARRRAVADREAVIADPDAVVEWRGAPAGDRDSRRRLREELRSAGDERSVLAAECEQLSQRRDQLAADVASIGQARDELAAEREALTDPSDQRRALAAGEHDYSLAERSRRSSLRWLALAALFALALALVLAVRLSM